jgi:hypothetical protein
MRFRGAALAALLAVAAVFLPGCAEKKVRAGTFRKAPLAHPRVSARSAQATDPVEPPELRLEAPATSRLTYPRGLPPKPRGSATGTSADAGRPAAPLISPQLTPEEQSAAQQQTDDGLRGASQDLQATVGRTLSPTQADLADKVRGFMNQAREAGRTGDWPRARNLAQKARLLARELADSLR